MSNEVSINPVSLAEFIAVRIATTPAPSAALLSSIITEFAMKNAPKHRSPKFDGILKDNNGKVIIFGQDAEDATPDLETPIKFAENGRCLKALADALKAEYKGCGLIKYQHINDIGMVVSISKKGGEKSKEIVKKFFAMLDAASIGYSSYNPVVSPTTRTAYQEFVSKVRPLCQAEGRTAAEAMIETGRRWHESQEKKDAEAAKALAKASGSKSPTTPVAVPASLANLANLPGVSFV